jgi:hypothetical protein
VGESRSHLVLVEQLISWVSHNFLNGDDGLILVDSPDSNGKPPRIGEFTPDAFVPNAGTHGSILGEAKTADDLENLHTHTQLTAFLRFCQENPTSRLVLAVPWQHVRFARNLIRLLQKKSMTESVNVTVLENLRG